MSSLRKPIFASVAENPMSTPYDRVEVLGAKGGFALVRDVTGFEFFVTADSLDVIEHAGEIES